MNIDISNILPKRYEGEITIEMLQQITAGLLNPSREMAVRLASELLKVKKGKR